MDKVCKIRRTLCVYFWVRGIDLIGGIEGPRIKAVISAQAVGLEASH